MTDCLKDQRPAKRPRFSQRDWIDPRAQRSRALLLEAAAALLQERGYTGCTIDAIIERTGVSRSTIYRHWPSRTELLAEVLNARDEQAVIADTGTLRGDLIAFLLERWRGLDEDPVAGRLQTLTGIIEAASHDRALVEVSTLLTSNLIVLIARMVEKARARGEIDRDCHPDMVAKLVIGGVLVQRTFLGQTLDDGYVSEMIDAILSSVYPTRRDPA